MRPSSLRLASRKQSPHFSLPCVRGEKALSCKEPGGLFAAFELGNGALFAPFPDRGGVSLAPRETVAHHSAIADEETEGLLNP